MELNKKQKESLFEALLSYAVKESAIKEINEMPTEEQIKDKNLLIRSDNLYFVTNPLYVIIL